jgi:uncharacterized protein
MLIVNSSYDLSWSYLFATRWGDAANRAAYFIVHFLAAGKFHSLFAFLFGWGFALQTGRAEARGVAFFPVYARRMFVLLLIGLATLIFWDATLFEYAIGGYALVLFRGRSLKTILVAALLCAYGWPVYDAITAHIDGRRRADVGTAEEARKADAEERAEEIADNEEDVRIHSKGSFSEIVGRDKRDAADEFWSDLREHGCVVFPLLLLGLYAGRRKILHDPGAHLGFIRRVCWWGLGLGIVGYGLSLLLFAYPGSYEEPWSWEKHLVFVGIGMPALCFFYASGVVLLAEKPRWRRRMAGIAPVGRMALSNYLLQILIFHVVFDGYGLGLYGRMGPLVGVGFGLLVIGVEVGVSTWWMKRFRFGPAEWLWRTLTYGKLQPMRRQAGVISAEA